MTDTLRERVAEVLWIMTGPNGPKDNWLSEADEMIALIRAEVLEEAARVADAENSDWDDYPTFATGWASAAENIAAAIRALKENDDA